MAVTGDGTRAVTGSADRTAMCGTWPAARRCTPSPATEKGYADVLRWRSPGTERAVTGSADRAAMVWDLASGRRCTPSPATGTQVQAIAVTGDGPGQ